MALFADVIVLAFVLAALDLSHFALGTVAIVIDAFAFIVDVGAILELFVSQITVHECGIPDSWLGYQVRHGQQIQHCLHISLNE